MEKEPAARAPRKHKKLRRLVSAILTLLLFVYLFVHISYTYRGYEMQTEFYGIPKNSLDVVFFGTSITFSGILPMELYNTHGFTSYVMATNMQYEGSLRWNLREVQKTQSPKLFVIDITPFVLETYPTNAEYTEDERDLYFKYNIDSLKYSLNRAAIVEESANALGLGLMDRLSWHLDLSRYHTNLPNIAKWNNSRKPLQYGFDYLAKNGQSVVDVSAMLTDDGSSMPLAEGSEKNLSLLIEEAKKAGGEVIFMCSPMSFRKERQYRIKNHVMEKIREAGFVFWDFTKDREKIGLDYATDYWNYCHFDALGAEKVSANLGRTLKENFDLPDRRADHSAPEWEQSYPLWLERFESYKNTDRSR